MQVQIQEEERSKGIVDLRFRSPLGPLVVSQLDLHSKHISLSSYRVPHDQQADVFVAECVKLSDFRLGVAHRNALIRAMVNIIIIIIIIITMLGVQVGNSTIVVIVAIEAKVGISFGIVKIRVAHIISTGVIIVQAGSPSLFLLGVDQLRRPAACGEEEK